LNPTGKESHIDCAGELRRVLGEDYGVVDRIADPAGGSSLLTETDEVAEVHRAFEFRRQIQDLIPVAVVEEAIAQTDVDRLSAMIAERVVGFAGNLYVEMVRDTVDRRGLEAIETNRPHFQVKRTQEGIKLVVDIPAEALQRAAKNITPQIGRILREVRENEYSLLKNIVESRLLNLLARQYSDTPVADRPQFWVTVRADPRDLLTRAAEKYEAEVTRQLVIDTAYCLVFALKKPPSLARIEALLGLSDGPETGDKHICWVTADAVECCRNALEHKQFQWSDDDEHYEATLGNGASAVISNSDPFGRGGTDSRWGDVDLQIEEIPPIVYDVMALAVDGYLNGTRNEIGETLGNTYEFLDQLGLKKKGSSGYLVGRSHIQLSAVEVDGVDEVLLIAEAASGGLDPLNP